MKKYIFEEKRIYIAEIEYNNTLHCAADVYKAFINKFPEHETAKYEYSVISSCVSVCKIYKESCCDFIEK